MTGPAPRPLRNCKTGTKLSSTYLRCGIKSCYDDGPSPLTCEGLRKGGLKYKSCVRKKAQQLLLMSIALRAASL